MAAVLQACIEESFDTANDGSGGTCFDQDLLDCLLQPLLPAAKQENPAAHALSQSVISHCSPLLQSLITQFINRVLVGGLTEQHHREEEELAEDDDAVVSPSTAPASHASSSSELAEHVYSLIYELHKIAPSLLLRILPNVCIQLQVCGACYSAASLYALVLLVVKHVQAEEVSTRRRAVKLLGRLFASPLANYAVEYRKNFRDFLGV